MKINHFNNITILINNFNKLNAKNILKLYIEQNK